VWSASWSGNKRHSIHSHLETDGLRAPPRGTTKPLMPGRSFSPEELAANASKVHHAHEIAYRCHAVFEARKRALEKIPKTPGTTALRDAVFDAMIEADVETVRMRGITNCLASSTTDGCYFRDYFRTKESTLAFVVQPSAWLERAEARIRDGLFDEG
jgi:hypothetical protein